jgi:hypothetical protein
MAAESPSDPPRGNRAAPPDCNQCRHFFITHEAARPYGCRAFAFVSARLPSLEVRANSGYDCEAFEERVRGGAR